MIKRKKHTLWIGLFCFLLSFKLLAASEDWVRSLRKAQNHLEAGASHEALIEYESLAAKGNGLAQFNLGLFYQLGWGEEIDRNKACEWFAKAANQHIPAAQYEHAQCISDNAEQNENIQLAIDWYLRAFNQHIFSAGCKAGRLMIKHHTTDETVRQGVTLCIEAAEKGSVDAALQVGKWYRDGNYVQQSDTSAVNYFMRAAPSSQPDAAFQLGQLLDSGLGVKTDIRQAIYWYEVAASHGDARAYLPVAALYWKLAQQAQTHRAHLLVKAYLWANVAQNTQATEDDSTVAQQLYLHIRRTLPEEWHKELDEKVAVHISSHH